VVVLMEGGRDKVGKKKSVIEDCRERVRGLVCVGERFFEDTLGDVGRIQKNTP
jgi:hypothetical protein